MGAKVYTEKETNQRVSWHGARRDGRARSKGDVGPRVARSGSWDPEGNNGGQEGRRDLGYPKTVGENPGYH